MSNKRNTTLTNAAFYAVLLFCLLGVGAGGWLLLSADDTTPSDTPDQQQTVISAADTDDTLTAVVSPTTITDQLPTDEEPESLPAEDPSEAESAEVSGTPDTEEPLQEVVVTVVAPADPEPAGPVTAEEPNPVVMPLEGEVAAVFSMDALTYNATLGDWRTHDGIDISAEAGTAVLAAAGGTVADIQEDSLLGTTVVLQHSDGYRTTYSSLEPELAVEFGQRVSSGQLIGAVGTSAASEAASGPHLHFSVSQNGTPVDPMEYLGR